MGINFTTASLAGLYIIDPERFPDERGFLARGYSEGEFAARGIHRPLVEAIISFNERRYTVRGLHYQRAPRAQAKLVRCTAGAIYDVVVDLRPDSPTYARWIGVELEAASCRMVYVPKQCAHGFLTLRDDCEVVYHMSDFHAPGSERGIRWDDPAIAIRWPAEVRIVSPRDAKLPGLDTVR